jgi:hypothetical protein
MRAKARGHFFNLRRSQQRQALDNEDSQRVLDREVAKEVL